MTQAQHLLKAMKTFEKSWMVKFEGLIQPLVAYQHQIKTL